jgi:hypothetical protein
MKKKTTIGFKTKKNEKEAADTRQEDEIEVLDDGHLESIMEGEEYHFENAVEGYFKKMKYVLLTQFSEAPLSIKTKMLNDYNTALITIYKLKNEK